MHERYANHTDDIGETTLIYTEMCLLQQMGNITNQPRQGWSFKLAQLFSIIY